MLMVMMLLVLISSSMQVLLKVIPRSIGGTNIGGDWNGEALRRLLGALVGWMVDGVGEDLSRRLKRGGGLT